MKLQHIARGAPPLRLTQILPQRLLLIGTATILLAFTACGLGVSDEPLEKDPPAGHVLELGTNRPIPGALVYLQKCNPVPFGSENCTRIDTVFSGSDGAYAFPITGFKVNAVKEGYFSGEDYFEYVEAGTESTTDIVLPPYAWLRVTLKNESGAYGFFPPSGGSGSEPVQISPGGTRVLPIELFRGNIPTKYIFSIRQDSTSGFPNADYWSTVRAFLNTTPTSIEVGIGAFIDVTPSGHDTTDLTIIY